MKKKIIMLPCIAAIAIATVVGKKTFESHANETSSLLMQNVEALSQGDNNDEGGTLWFREDQDCEYTATGKAGAKVTLSIAGVNVVTLTIGTDGTATYVAKDAQTHCRARGNEQCEARYCPIAFWN